MSSIDPRRVMGWLTLGGIAYVGYVGWRAGKSIGETAADVVDSVKKGADNVASFLNRDLPTFSLSSPELTPDALDTFTQQNSTDGQYMGTALGMRNKNPGNLRGGGAWQGLVGHDARGFNIFSDVHFGLRALSIDLRHKIERLRTIERIMGVYAPPVDPSRGETNDTLAYILRVAQVVGATPQEPLTADERTVTRFMRAIVDHENGADGALVSDGQILAAYRSGL